MDDERNFASPACLAHELGGDYMGHATRCEIVAALRDILASDAAAALAAGAIAAGRGEPALAEIAQRFLSDSDARRAGLKRAILAREATPGETAEAPPASAAAVAAAVFAHELRSATDRLRALIPRLAHDRAADRALRRQLVALRASYEATIVRIERLRAENRDAAPDTASRDIASAAP